MQNPAWQAVADAHHGIFFNHGQCCAAGSRVYVHEAVYDQFCEKSVALAMKRCAARVPHKH